MCPEVTSEVDREVSILFSTVTEDKLWAPSLGIDGQVLDLGLSLNPRYSRVLKDTLQNYSSVDQFASLIVLLSIQITTQHSAQD